jgi:protein-L-isoaspartate(D-aspartate) O-methyltransferase
MAAPLPADAEGAPDPGFADLRRRMAEDLAHMGIADPRVLAAMARVPRHRFVPEPQRRFAYADGPLPIGDGQTISQPYMVAAMTEALRLGGAERVLEVGTGSGYQCAVLAELAREVVTVERISELSERAGAVLADLGYTNVVRVVGDGTLGAPEHSPYDAIVVTAGAPAAPEPLLAQLADGGRLVVPEGGRGIQTLVRYTRRGRNIHTEALMQCMFVPLIGRHGWSAG